MTLLAVDFWDTSAGPGLRPAQVAAPSTVLPRGDRQRPEPLHDRPEQPPRQVPFRQQQPVIPSVFDQATTRLHQALPGVAEPPSTLPPAIDPGSSAPIPATPLAAPAQPAVVVSPPPPSGLAPGSSAAMPPTPAHGAQHPDLGPAPVPSPVGVVQEAHTGRTLAVLEGRPEFHVQAGAFRTREYADDLVRQLRAKGYTVTLVEGSLIRVRVGPPMSQQAAERLAANLRLQRFEATLIPTR